MSALLRDRIPTSARTLALVGFVLWCALALGGCGADDDAGSSQPSSSPSETADATSSGSPAPTGVPTSGPSGTDTGHPLDVKDLLRRCVRPTRVFQVARLYYAKQVALTVGVDHTYTVKLAPRDYASRGGATPGPDSEDFELSCVIRATLRVDQSLQVNPTAGQRQLYVPPAVTAFSWLVDASAAGTHSALLDLQPVLRVADGQRTSDYAGTTVSLPITFVAREPAAPKRSIAKQAGGFFTSTLNVVLSAAGAISVIGGAVAVLIKLRPAKKDAAAGGDGNAPSDDAPRRGRAKRPKRPF